MYIYIAQSSRGHVYSRIGRFLGISVKIPSFKIHPVALGQQLKQIIHPYYPCIIILNNFSQKLEWTDVVHIETVHNTKKTHFDLRMFV